MLWTSFWTGGGIGRYDPMKKSWTTYLMPKSRNGTYAVYVDDKDRRVGDRLARQRDPALRSGDRNLRDISERQARRGNPRDPGPARRGLGRRAGNDRLVVVRD